MKRKALPGPAVTFFKFCFQLKKGRFKHGKNFFTMRVVRHWNRPPREVAGVPLLEMFNVLLDGALTNPVQRQVSLSRARVLGVDEL